MLLLWAWPGRHETQKQTAAKGDGQHLKWVAVKIPAPVDYVFDPMFELLKVAAEFGASFINVLLYTV